MSTLITYYGYVQAFGTTEQLLDVEGRYSPAKPNVPSPTTVNFDTNLVVSGSAISINNATGVLTLSQGRSYALEASTAVNLWRPLEQNISCYCQWFNITTNQYIGNAVPYGQLAVAIVNTTASSMQVALKVFPTIDKLRLTWATSGVKGLTQRLLIARDISDLGYENDILKGIIGPQGLKGDAGTNGTNGTKGDKGDQGVKGDIGPKGDVGQVGAVGPRGAQGLQGPSGPQGVGIPGATGVGFSTAAVNTSGQLIITKTDRTSFNAGNVVGPRGVQGPVGPANIGPAFIATITSGTSIPVATGPSIAQLPLMYNNVIKNDGFGFNQSTGVFTAPIAGYYQVSVGFAPGMSQQLNVFTGYYGAALSGIYKNNVPVAAGQWVEAKTRSWGSYFAIAIDPSTVSSLIFLNAGDTLQSKVAYITNYSGFTTYANIVQNYFQAVWIRA